MKVIDRLPETLVIDRKKWARGHRKEPNRLLSSIDGTMCCLGFASIACGLSEDEIRDKAAPMSLVTRGPVCRISPLVDRRGNHTEIALDLMEANDDSTITESEREAAISTKFTELGVAVTFIN